MRCCSLDHPGIPRYLEWFEEDTEEDRAFCLVQVRRGAGGRGRSGRRAVIEDTSLLACLRLPYLPAAAPIPHPPSPPLQQELAEGKSLEEMVRSGWRADEAEVTRIAVELLGTLQYLGSRRPPVVHRDIKPQVGA